MEFNGTEYPCTCPRTHCPRHGNCFACVANHRKSGTLPGCYHNPPEGDLGVHSDFFKGCEGLKGRE